MRDQERERIEVNDFLKLFPEASRLFEMFLGKVLIEKEVYNGKDYYWLTIETRWERQYVIRVNVCDDGSTYFGAWSESRLVRPFETWHRGNDFTDGRLNDETINRFITDVIDDLFVDVPDKEKRTGCCVEQCGILNDVKVQLDK